MDFPEWEPHYLRIVREFGFSVTEDEQAAHRLASLGANKTMCGPDCLRRRIGKEVTVVGHGPALEAELRTGPLQGTVIAADGATSTLVHSIGKVPDIIVTDLDGDIADQLSASAQGAVAVILAHGDNVEALERYVPWFTGPLTLTTQARPFDRVYNFGGFTDGDRAVMLARHFGARKVHLVGFDMFTPRPKMGRDPEIKKRKLEEARKLIWDLNPSDVELIPRSSTSLWA
ncbi:MAG: 6-hydroxymethylpterin diphosphokinase MptE-like protein [Methanomassiliicoccus sp.]|nr:6-hydroxymethylpterin diphosphokinase MptE-like protein [Methanomassiliicoccus sp.]